MCLAKSLPRLPTCFLLPLAMVLNGQVPFFDAMKAKIDAFVGPWKDHRDYHGRPDLILLYRKPDNDHLDLVRLGSHGLKEAIVARSAT